MVPPPAAGIGFRAEAAGATDTMANGRNDMGSTVGGLDGRTVGRFSVHVLTAAGAACALLALVAATAGQWSLMFAWLGLALVVDAADGPLARRFEVARTLPRWSGETLDLVIDFTTYVFVPAYAIVASGVLPAWSAAVAGVSIVMSGALYFADRAMKTPDNYFRGFPALWNIAAFYLLLVRPPPLFGLAFVAALVAATFMPFPFIHPMRVRRHRAFNIALLALWGVLALAAVIFDMRPPVWVTAVLCVIGLYVVCAGYFRTRP
jgi:phosphatidylcholine synthase